MRNGDRFKSYEPRHPVVRLELWTRRILLGFSWAMLCWGLGRLWYG